MHHNWLKKTETGRRDPDVWLIVDFEIRTRERHQATDINGRIGGRLCYGLPDEFIPERKEKRTIDFPVPRDAARKENYGYVEMEFGGAKFMSDVFRVSPMPLGLDKAESTI